MAQVNLHLDPQTATVDLLTDLFPGGTGSSGHAGRSPWAGSSGDLGALSATIRAALEVGRPVC